MASFNNASQIGLPATADLAFKETPDQILANFQEIFKSQIEPDVVLLVFTECDFNVNATLECLFALIGESSKGKFDKEDRDLQASALSSKPNKSGPDSTCEKSIYKNRISTIYKSNEGLYSEDAALNGEDLNPFSEFPPLHGTGERAAQVQSQLQYNSCADASPEPQAEHLSLSLHKAGETSASQYHSDQAAGGSNLKKTFPKTQLTPDPRAKWDSISNIRLLSEIQDPLSPDSDKSIEADASEHIDIDIGSAKDVNVSQPSVANCVGFMQFETMASKQTKRGKPPQDAQTGQSLWEAHCWNAGISFIANEYGQVKPTSQWVKQKTPTKKQVSHQNPQAKKNPNPPAAGQPHTKRQPQPNQRQMNPKEYVLMHIANGRKILVLLRGCPGSGKTTLANEIKFNGVIFSTDNFFMKNGQYRFEPERLPEAHAHNQLLAMRAMRVGRTPIIVDNTNLLQWEMDPYVALAMQNQYTICLLEPMTPWRYDARQLTLKNTHNIGYDRIVNMLQRFDHSATTRGLIEHYNSKTRMYNVRPPNMHNDRAATPNHATKIHPHPRRKKKPKANPQTPQTSVPIETTGGQPTTSVDTNSSDSDSDGWSTMSNSGQADYWGQPLLNNKIQKSKSIPNLMLHTDNYKYSIKPENAPVSYNLIDPSTESPNGAQKLEPKVSENMRDLLDLDFSTPSIPPIIESEKCNQIQDDTILRYDAREHPEKRRVGRIAAAFLDMPPDWDMPEFPTGVENGATGITSESRLGLSQEGSASGAASSKSDLKHFQKLENPGGMDESPTTDKLNEIRALKLLFPKVSDVLLKDFYNQCKGNPTWVVDLLLDAGYEICAEKLDEDLFQKSGSSVEGLAEISSDEESEIISQNAKAHSDQSSAADVTVQDWQSSSCEKDNQMLLRIDPMFAMQLQEMFGPVGFHLSPASYYGNDLGIFIPTSVAQKIHDCWASSLKAKFESEDAEIDKMMDSVALDENFAKRLQEEEDHLLARTLQSDPLGENFPPLETKHVLMTLEKSTPKTEDLASRIKRRQLYEMFPKIDRKALDEVFNANNGSFSEAVQAVEISFCPDQKPKLVIAPEQLEEYERALVKFAEQESLLLEMGRMAKTRREMDETDNSEPTYDDWRTEASLHYRLRQECFSKAKEAYDKGMMAAASFYSQQGRVHSQKLHEANKRASEKILESRNANCKGDTLDLHMLHVNESITALAEFLESKKQELRRGSNSQMTLRIITGRGNHSALGVPRIKPAVLEFLENQNYSHHDSNGGLIEVILRK